MIPTARYFPLRFHAIRSLNQLSRATRTFIPVAPMLLEVVDSQYVKGKTKKGVSKPPLFPYIYKACGGPGPVRMDGF
jgi:nucleolar complex protein 2